GRSNPRALLKKRSRSCPGSLLERKFEGISFSFGICSLYDNINEAIEHCDKLMYKNKYSRKNKMLNSCFE
ncbi:hypothetical protein OD806_11225, partial [Aeromonas veronii]|uniref:hypothetical protein n=1 Tax=Aeromonas veronii TaxID=654 RepID=UPI002247C660